MLGGSAKRMLCRPIDLFAKPYRKQLAHMIHYTYDLQIYKYTNTVHKHFELIMTKYF